jgi:hypothetical protein
VGKTNIRSQDIGDAEVATADLADDCVTKDKLGILTTKGDLITFSTEPIRLAAGTDGQLLVADSASAGGMKWADGLTAANIIESETPTGSVNGINDTFTLANTPVAGSVKLYKNGIRQRAGAGNDYTIASGTITFLAGNLPQTGDILLVDYRK